MFKRMKQVAGIKRRKSTRASTSQASSVELTPSPGHGDPEAEIPEERPALLITEEHLDIKDDREGQAIALMRERPFAHTRRFDPDFLEKIGMREEFASIFRTMGWLNFVEVDEPGSRLLTMQFLCTLRKYDEGISFRLFGQERLVTWGDLHAMLGLNPKCRLDLDKALKGFHKESFWKKISGNEWGPKPRTSAIHNPTLRFMHVWLAMTLFPRGDIRVVRQDELKILYAMVKKIRVSPAECMIDQWLDNIKLTGPIECTSLVTRIAQKCGLLENVHVEYLTVDREFLGEDYFVQGHTLKHGPNNTLIYHFPGYTNEFPLPNPGLRLYHCRALTLPLEPVGEVRRHSVSGRPTRSRRHMEPTPEFHTPTGDPVWEQPPPQDEAGASTWQAGAWESQYDYPMQTSSSSSGPPSFATRSFSSRGFRELNYGMAELTRRVNDIDLRTESMQQTLTQHVADTQQWQNFSDNQFRQLNAMMAQNQNNWDAFFRSQGYDPNQQI